MTLFLGGPRHGQDVEVPPERQSLLDTATDQPRKPKPSLVDIGSATTYYLRPVSFVTPHPLTGQPDKTYTQDVYVHETLSPQDAMQALPSAVLSRWFTTEGTLQPAQPQSPPEQRETVTP